MSLAPLPTGSAATAIMVLEPGWTITIDEFNMDVLSFKAQCGSLNTLLAICPDKYSQLSTTLNAGYLVLPTITGTGETAFQNLVNGVLSCSDRVITPGEGLSAEATLTYKGFVSSTPRNPIWSVSWQTTPLSIPIQGVVNSTVYTFSFPAPYMAQITEKFGTTGNYSSNVGDSGLPYGSPTIPSNFIISLAVAGGGSINVYGFATSTEFQCAKDDRQEAGAYNARTQVWERTYVFSI